MVLFNESFLYNLSNKKFLSEILGIELKILKYLEDYLETEDWKAYKLKNTQRDLYNPSYLHKKALKRLNKALYTIPLPNYLFGGIKRKSYIGNARQHQDSEYFLICDITKFFPSTHESYVYDLFRNKLCMSTDIAKILTLLVTYQHETNNYRYLPQGFPTSPILSYLSYTDMFFSLEKFATRHGLVFTAYYDDLTFSSGTFIPKSIKKELSGIMNSFNFKLNDSKTKFQKRKTNKVTGVIVTENGLKAPHKLTTKLMQVTNDLKNENASNIFTEDEIISYLNKVRGYIAAIKAIDTERNLQVYQQEINKFL